MVVSCLWKGKPTPVITTQEFGPLSLVRVSDYAKIHGVETRTVLAAIAEKRISPEAFPVPHEGLPVDLKSTESRWLVCVGAVIAARDDGTGKVP